MLDLLKVSPPEHLDGSSFSADFSGDSSDSRQLLGETDYPLRFGWAPLRSLRTATTKLIDAPRPEYYDLQADPKELKNIFDAA